MPIATPITIRAITNTSTPGAAALDQALGEAAEVEVSTTLRRALLLEPSSPSLIPVGDRYSHLDAGN
jgi:hypothetical protein